MENTGQYRGGTRLTGPVVGFATFDEEQLRRLKLVMSLYMSVTQLALCAAQCRATGHVPDAEEIYFLDSFVSRSAQRADAHTVTRLTTADAALAEGEYDLAVTHYGNSIRYRKYSFEEPTHTSSTGLLAGYTRKPLPWMHEGWFRDQLIARINHYKEAPELAVLRERDDFRNLIREYEKYLAE